MEKIKFQLCLESDLPFIREGFVAELKYDGRRFAVRKTGERIEFFGRNDEKIYPERYPELVAEFKKIPFDFVADGEIVVFDSQSRINRGLLQTRDKIQDKFKIKMASKLYPATAILFDLLEVNEQDLRNESYLKRRQEMADKFSKQELENKDFSQIKIANEWQDPLEAWAYVNEHKLEGIVEKDITSKYTGRRQDWFKVKRKDILQIKVSGYEITNSGLTLISQDGIHRIAVNGQQHIAVKKEIDEKGFAMIEIRRMAGVTEKGRSREPVFSRLI